jgi:DNA-binding CsgD family transcriptional regulator
MLTDRAQDPDLIARFYEAAAQPGRWEAALTALCEAFEADTGVLFHQPHGDTTPHLLAANPRATQAKSIGADYFKEQAAREEGYHRLRASVELDGGARAGMGLNRPVGAVAFDDGERAALDRVARHLAAALRLESRLAVERLNSAARGAALDQLRHGALIVTARSEVLFANFAAESMADGGGLCIGGLGGIVGCTDHKEDAALTALIRAAALGQAGGTTRISRAAGLPILAATVTPLPLALAAGHARALALVTIRDLGVASDAGQADWMALFGLTAAEAAILPQIAAGDSMALIAQSRGVNTATVRAQVTRVLEKTGAPNMRALATMISGW